MGTSGVLLDKRKIIQALFNKKGIIEHAAASIGCDPTSIYHWMKKDEEVAAAVKDARAAADQERIDKDNILRQKAYESAEALLGSLDATMTIFTLKSKCGWTQEVTNHAITINRIERPYREKLLE
jgi:hypothetical protein